MSIQIVSDPGAYCTMCRQFTYKLRWLPEKHHVAGTQIEIRSHKLRAFIGWRYTAFRIEKADITFRCKSRPTVSELRLNWDRILFRSTLMYGARKGEHVDFEMTVIPPIWAGINNTLSLWTIDVKNNFQADAPEPESVVENGSECELTVRAAPVERLSLYSRPSPDPDGKVRTILVPEDRFGNPGSLEKPVSAILTWEDTEQTIEIKDTVTVQLDAPRNIGRATLTIPMDQLATSDNIENGNRRDGNLVVTGNPVWANGPDNLKPAFGEFHWHTDFSGDGQRPIKEALRSARDYLNMDYIAPGDHNPQGKDWDNTVEALEEFNDDDQFATFFGWEAGSDRGHENYYFTDPDHPLVCGGSGGITGGKPDQLVEQLTELYKTSNFISIPHHTNAVAETRKIEDDTPFWHPYPWTEPRDFIRLIEIMQTRGNQECDVYDDVWRGWHQNNHASAQDALALGYKIGFTGGTDNHCGWPGRAYASCEGQGIHRPKSVILTGVWTPRIERQSVYDSLNARHTWAVWDTRALVAFSVNSALSGEEIEVTTDEKLTAHLRMSAEDALQTVEVVSDGNVIWQDSFVDLDFEIDVPLGKATRSTYFYLRALQRNGGIIYASPVFVTVT